MSVSITNEAFASDTSVATPESEIIGPEDAPVIVILGGISASRHVTRTPAHGAGWWDRFVGEGKTVDTRRFRILGIDYPAHDASGRPLSTQDQARTLAKVLDTACIPKVFAIIGASYGGMIALAFGALFPDRAGRLIVIGAAHRTTVAASALRHLQRRVVKLGVAAGMEREAVAIARGIAMTAYTTPEDLEQRFGDARSAVTVHLDSSGERFARSCSSTRFLALTQSIELHDVRPEDIGIPALLIAVREDALVPVALVRELSRRIGNGCRLVELSSAHGHDTFLLDPDLLAPHVARSLSPLTLERA